MLNYTNFYSNLTFNKPLAAPDGVRIATCPQVALSATSPFIYHNKKWMYQNINFDTPY